MPRPKKHTQFIFDQIKDPERKELYGDLGIAYEIFDRITKERFRRHLTQQQLSDKLEIKQPTLARIESGKANPSIYTLIAILEGLDLKMKIVEK